MKKEKGPLTKLWLESRQFIKENKLEQAEESLDRGIAHLSFYSLQGVGDKSMIEGVKKETWHERFWIAIEQNIWPTFPDYEKNWKI